MSVSDILDIWNDINQQNQNIMSRRFTTRDFINSNEETYFNDVFYLHKQTDSVKKSTSYYSKDRKHLHIEICVPNTKFKPYAILNTSSNTKKEITILINDNSPNRYQTSTGLNKKKILVLDFLFDNLQNSKIHPFKFDTNNPEEEIKFIIIHDKFDFVAYEWNENDAIHPYVESIMGMSDVENKQGFYDKHGRFFYPEPKEDGEGVIIEGP